MSDFDGYSFPRWAGGDGGKAPDDRQWRKSRPFPEMALQAGFRVADVEDVLMEL